MTPATNRIRETAEAKGPTSAAVDARPLLTLLDGDSTLVARAVSGTARGKAAEEELYRRYRPAVAG